MRLLAFRAVFAVLLALLVPAAAVARGTLDNILPQIRAQHPGRLSDAEAWTDDAGGTHYRIKWMTPEGRILFFDADARTGRYGAAGDDALHGNRNDGRGGRGDDENGGQGERRTHFAGDDGNDDGGNDWRNRDNGRDNNNGAWSRSAGDWRDRGQQTVGEGRDRGQGGGDWRNNRGGGNWGGGRGGGNGNWGGHGGGDNRKHGHEH